ncbi:MAG: glycosyltransferase family 9 protein [Pirellulaceae bacterium]|jgi:heptosyltransferase-2|nr:glycosyltransferase family 9 protein [Pirellulaceae bacterium]
MRIGVLLPNWVGDCVMATPTLRALRRRFPAAQITGIARPHLLSLFSPADWLDQRLAWEHRGSGWLKPSWLNLGWVAHTAKLIGQLRSEPFDLLLVLRNSGLAAAVARASGAKQTIGYARRGSGLFLSRAIAPPRAGGRFTPISAIDYYLQLAEAAGCPTESPELELSTTEQDEAAADAIWQRLDLPDPEEVVLVNTGGAYGAAKQWPAEHASELARELAEQDGFTTVFLCGPDEREHAARLAAAADHPRVKSLATEDVRFGPTKAFIRRASLLVSTDSGPRHIAAAVGTPTITLFGPIDPAWSENYQSAAIRLHLRLDCAPCGKRTCPLAHHRCLRDLTPAMVRCAVHSLRADREFSTARPLRMSPAATAAAV